MESEKQQPKDINFFNLDETYRLKLINLFKFAVGVLSISGTLLAVITWFVVEEVETNRNQTEMLAEIIKDIALINKDNEHQNDKIEQNAYKTQENSIEIRMMKKKIENNHFD